MSKQISLNPDEMENLANGFVHKISDLEFDYKDLHLKLADLIMSAPYEYTHCFSNVGDTWQTGSALVNRLSEMEQDIRNTAEKFVERDDYIGKMYNLYDKYGTLTAMGALVSNQAFYYGMGLTNFLKKADGVSFRYRHSTELMKISRYVDGYQYRNVIRGYISPTSFFRKELRDASFADLLHKRYAKYLPQEVIGHHNSSRNLKSALEMGRLTKTDVMDFLSTGKKIARANAGLTFLVTGAVETVGMGLKISDNYAKYGNDPAVLKRENAKAVGNAVNKTVMVGTFSVGGAVIGGTLLSVAGPMGTVVGGAIGSAVGGFVGEYLAKYTAGFAERTAIKFQDSINSGLNSLKGLATTAGEVKEKFDTVKDKVNEEIKETLKNPLGKAGEFKDKAKETANSLLDEAKDFMGLKFS